jgi:outer membrane protein assembly factor BamB
MRFSTRLVVTNLFLISMVLVFLQPAESSGSSPGYSGLMGQSRAKGPDKPYVAWKYNQYEISHLAFGSDRIYFNVGNVFYAINKEGSLKWTHWNDGSIHGIAIGSDGTIYYGTSDGIYSHSIFSALNSDGSLKWQFQTGNSIYSSPIIGEDGTIYFGCKDKYFYALNSDGTLKWKYLTDNEIEYAAPIIGEDGTIYIGSLKTDSNLPYLYAFNPDGTLKWRFSTPYDINNTPALALDGTIYVLAGKYLSAINPNGTLKWEFDVPSEITYISPVVANDGTIYFGCEHECNLYAINPDGALKWTFKIDALSYTTPLIDSEGTIYFGSKDGNFFALHPDGKQKWVFEFNGDVGSPRMDDNGTIYIVNSGTLYAITESPTPLEKNPWSQLKHDAQNTGRCPFIGPDNGAIIWSFYTGDAVRSSPAIDKYGSIIFGSDTGFLYSLSDSGFINWQYQLKQPARSSPALSEDGTVYIVTGDGSKTSLLSINTKGTKNWDFPMEGTLSDTSAAIAEDGTIYALTWKTSSLSTFYLYAVNPDGTEKWNFSVEAKRADSYWYYWIPEKPAIGNDGTIYVTGGFYLYAFNPDGSLKWEKNHYEHELNVSFPSVGGDIVFFCGDHGTWSTLEYLKSDGTYPSNATIKWFEAYPITSFSSGGGYLKVGHYTTSVSDLSSGEIYLKTGKFTASSPIIDANGTLYVGSGNHYLIAGDPNTGNEKWRVLMYGEIHSTPAMGADGTIYVGCDDGYIYAIGEGNNVNPVATGVDIIANQQGYSSGDTLRIDAKIVTKESVDFYCAALINNTLYWYPNWIMNFSPTLVQLPQTIEILNLVLPQNPPIGNYTFFAMITEHGTLNLISSDSLIIRIE